MARVPVGRQDQSGEDSQRRQDDGETVAPEERRRPGPHAPSVHEDSSPGTPAGGREDAGPADARRSVGNYQSKYADRAPSVSTAKATTTPRYPTNSVQPMSVSASVLQS